MNSGEGPLQTLRDLKVRILQDSCTIVIIWYSCCTLPPISPTLPSNLSYLISAAHQLSLHVQPLVSSYVVYHIIVYRIILSACTRMSSLHIYGYISDVVSDCMVYSTCTGKQNMDSMISLCGAYVYVHIQLSWTDLLSWSYSSVV